MAPINILMLMLASFFITIILAAPAIESRAPDLSIGDITSLLGLGMVTEITAFLTLQSIVTNRISVAVQLQNLLPLELTIDSLALTAGSNNSALLTFEQAFTSPGLVIPLLSQQNTGTIPNVVLPQGALPLFAVTPLAQLDILSLNISVRAASISGQGGIPLALNNLQQSEVPTNYSLALL
ncbi:hypothetical protein BDQ17DRAFT_1538034 [Cyathus striatus]|nr:hypothetical protein BDQ17DRAFT_1538034 [Cyathus striatus]